MRERVLGVSPYGVWNLAVWPLVTGRMASGLSPRGVTSFVHARLGIKGNQGRMVSNLPSLCPHTCSRPPVVPHVPSPRRVEIAFLAGFMVCFLHWWRQATSHGGRRSRMRRAVLDSAEQGLGSSLDRKRFQG